jgi:acetoacetyl-CoA synthetase
MSKMDSDILWTPSADRQRNSALWEFAETTSKLHGAAPGDYARLHRWSIDEPEAFYSALWNHLGIVGDRGNVAIAKGPTLRETRFFPEAKLNYAENLLQWPDDRIAIIGHRDDGTRRSVTRRGLYDLVSRFAQALRADGVGPGDRVGAIVTNDIESIAAYLATNAIGAIWCSCSPDFGPEGASDRLNQVEPKILLAVPVYSYAGKTIVTTAAINAVASGNSVQRIVLLGEAPQGASYDKPAVVLDTWFAPFAPDRIDFDRGPFDRPMVILFTSGTTGKPKCIIHCAGGLLLQHKKEHRLHCDMGRGDVFFYFTTCGWMMWNWMISGLAVGATLVTYDGSPFYPEPTRLMDLIDAEGITIFGTSAKYIATCAKSELDPKRTHSLESVRTVLSTGSVLLPENFDYVYEKWKSDVHLVSISGGTDIGCCFVGGVPLLPVRRGEIQAAALGMDVDALDAEGHPVTGVPGELVCRNAHPAMPLGFWGDTSGQRYHDAYFERFEGMWAHGDYIEKRPSGGFVIHGRSDTTLNPGGVRIGTAEIYRIVERIETVQEAIAAGQMRDGDERVVLFVKMKPGATLDDALRKQIKDRIRAGATPRHVPAAIVEVPDIPRTRSGKISEIAVRDSINGRPIGNTTSLANASCLDFYRQWGSPAA